MIILYIIIGFIGGAVFSYLFFRSNPNKKDIADQWVDKTKDGVSGVSGVSGASGA